MSDAGLWISFGTAVRLFVGWFSIVIGLLNLLAEADRRTGEPDTPYLLFHGVLILGGIMLLTLGWLAEDPGRAGYVAGGAMATIGLLASALPATNSLCCMVGHGFPFTFRGRAESVAQSRTDLEHLVADLLFWGYAGLLVLVIVALFRRVTSRPAAEEPPIAPGRSGHAEPAALADQPLPAGKTVGGLP